MAGGAFDTPAVTAPSSDPTAPGDGVDESPPADRDATAAGQPAPRLERRVLTRLAGWYALSRVLVWAAVLGGWTLRPELSLDALLRRLDASWYIDTARFGYVAQAATPDAVAADPAVLRGAFFPLWPLVARVTRPPGVPLEVSATVVATLLGFGVVVGSWLLVARLADRDAADRAALLVCVFPGSFVLSMAYAEALMLCLAVTCLLALLRRRWLVAGLAAALATATRPNAIALVASCAWAAAVAVHHHRELRSLLAPALAPLGVLGFHGFLWWRTGRADAWNLIQRNGWEEEVDLGVRNSERLAALLRWDAPEPGTVLIGLGAVVLLFGAWALWRWRPPLILALYAAGVVGLALVAQTLGPRPRFVFTALPLVWALGVWLRGQRYRLVVMASTCGLAVLSIMYIVGSVAKP